MLLANKGKKTMLFFTQSNSFVPEKAHTLIFSPLFLSLMIYRTGEQLSKRLRSLKAFNSEHENGGAPALSASHPLNKALVHNPDSVKPAAVAAFFCLAVLRGYGEW